MNRWQGVVVGAAVLSLVWSHLASGQPVTAPRTEAVVMRVGANQSLALKSGKAIQTARTSNDTVVRLAADEKNPKVALLAGLRPGVSRVTLRDIDGGEETVVVAVEGADSGNGPPVARQGVVKALRDAMRAERSVSTRLIMAESLIRVAPDDTAAAQELIDALLADDDTLPAEAYITMERLMPTAPSALVNGLVPLLKNREEIDRRRAALLLSKIDPSALRE